jgi:hypothetical protein
MKIKKTFTFKKEALIKIINFCKKNNINASGLTEKLWMDYIEKYESKQ